MPNLIQPLSSKATAISMISMTLLKTQSVRLFIIMFAMSSIPVAYAAGEKLALGQERIEDNENTIAEEMIDLITQISQQRTSEGPIKRFNQAKSLGCFNADFQVEDELPDQLKKGLFAKPGHYPARLRFANASESDDRKKDIRGLSIKVMGVDGETLWGEDSMQDFILNSHPALFAATPEDFLQFIKAISKDRVWSYFVNPMDLHLKSLWIIFKGRKKIASPFDIRYWSTTPYLFGKDKAVAVKYSVQSCSTINSEMPDPLNENYLTQVMKKHLQQAPACFDFMVQFQTDVKKMPVEDASVIWDESDSPFLKVATITIEDQVFTDEQSLSACEQISFNPWQSQAAHKPLGGINRVRKAVYKELSLFRNLENKSSKKLE